MLIGRKSGEGVRGWLCGCGEERRGKGECVDFIVARRGEGGGKGRVLWMGLGCCGEGVN